MGAGRKGLKVHEMLLIGAECARRWEELAEKEALDRYEALPETKAIRIEQSRADMIPQRLRKNSRETLEDIAEDIDDITGGVRRVSIPLKRPHGAKREIIAGVSAWIKLSYGRSVSASQISESWKRWNKFKKSPDYKGSLNST
jgi:hypothetical protein